jgi:phage/plasmid-like protein (TIGR03299 family)
MAHMIDMTNNRANIAYIGATPWHGMGAVMQPDSTLDQWRVAAGLNYSVKQTPVMFNNGTEMVQGEGKVLYRDDTGSMLSVVSDRYQTVQPETVVEFYRDLTAQHGFKIETMGALSDGKRVWALARTGGGFTIGKNDAVETYLLLATSYDKSMATRAQFTTVRVVCHNTLSMAVMGKSDAAISISHSTMFNADRVKLDLNLVQDNNVIMQDAFTAMASVKVGKQDAVRWIAKVMFDESGDLEEISTRKENIIHNVYNLYNGQGKGSSFETANGTAFGLMNAVTEYIDHHAARNANNRLLSAWFGKGEQIKATAYNEALALAA